jgi:phosphate/sulfate permease
MPTMSAIQTECAAAPFSLDHDALNERLVCGVRSAVADLQPIHGFAAETSATTVTTLASGPGIPVSATRICRPAIPVVLRRFK